jgi:hypothetical protein
VPDLLNNTNLPSTTFTFNQQLHLHNLHLNQLTMSQDMDWSPTFCLACDIQTDGNAYCGEACRLAEYESANTGSEASSPASHQGSVSWPVQQSTTFHLPSAYDFTKKASRPRPQSQPIYARPALTPSSSQSSLFSMQSTSSTSSASAEQVQLSEETRRELRGYASCFDQSRYHRRNSAH